MLVQRTVDGEVWKAVAGSDELRFCNSENAAHQGNRLIPPGAKLPDHIHDYANAGFILSGSLTVYGPDGATRTLHVNDSLIELVGIPHSGANEGDENAVVLVFYAGQMGQPLSRPAP